jgi:nicotinamidase-related amidase
MKKDTAVIIIDMQEFFLNNFPKPIVKQLIENQKQIINVCLKKGLPFILLEYKTRGIFRGPTIPAIKNLVKKSVIQTIIKENNSGFTKTNLDTILKENKIKKVLLVGINANACVQDTAIVALFRGYQVITAEGIMACASRGDMSLSKANKNGLQKILSFLKTLRRLRIILNKYK